MNDGLLFNVILFSVLGLCLGKALKSAEKLFFKKGCTENQKLDRTLLLACVGINPDFLLNKAFLDYARNLSSFDEAHYLHLAEYYSCRGRVLSYVQACVDLQELKGSGVEEIMLARIIDMCCNGEYDQEEYTKLENYARHLGTNLSKVL